VRPSDLDTLELPRLLGALSAHAASSAGREACLALRPRLDVSAVRDELARVARFRAITEDEPAPLGDFPDVRPLVAESRTGGARLSGEELREIASVLRTVGAMRVFLRARAPGDPGFLALAGSLHSMPELERLLADSIDEDGNLRDEASPRLRALRRELRSLRADIEERLSRLFRQSGTASAIADQYVTVRNGRFVVPVRAGSADAIAGVVQDRSASGETLFVEPLFAVEPNNRMTIARREEEEEVARILGEITSEVGRNADAIADAFSALVALDTLAARASFARRHDAVCPEVGSRVVVLRGARHPLLALTGRAVVPVDLELDESTRLLVVTGPNTGGKSVALKTLGLAAAMAQSGIPVLAAEGATLPVFDATWTDIGDPQSLTGDLSTFSGHVRNLGEILAGATRDSLVLLDEPGTGTDPEDGSALAKVLLRELSGRGALVLATTHFQGVKAFALSAPHAIVAAVDFDPETFAPRYRLVPGSVGPSLGLAMARRLGLPDRLLDEALAERGTATADLAEAVDRLDRERRRYEELAVATESEREELRRARAEHDRLLAELRAKRDRKWSDELGEAKRFADDLKREARRMLADAKEQARADARGAARRLADGGRAQGDAIAAKQAELAGGHATEPSRGGATRPIAVGDTVEVLGSGLRGQVARIDGARASVARGSIRFDVPLAQLRFVSAGAAARTVGPGGRPGPSVASLVRKAARHAPADPFRERDTPDTGGDDDGEDGESTRPLVAFSELNLIGERVAPALVRLEAFLDQSVLEDRNAVRIVHGFGTGALRAAVRDFLARSPYVARFVEADPAHGGAGATVVELR
jgi:DNA mismatch repair protein MutS2